MSAICHRLDSFTYFVILLFLFVFEVIEIIKLLISINLLNNKG